MAQDPGQPTELAFLLQVLDLYEALMGSARQGAAAFAEPGLGGLLLYAGRLADETRALIVAANIAGAATLTVSDDPAAPRQAIRDGVVDFAVTTLDEALRILKNQLRKGETVAVCVGAAPDAVEAEMRDRGVAPDLIGARRGSDAKIASGFARNATSIEPLPMAEDRATVTWNVAGAAPLWLPRLDALALACLDAEAWIERRWLRQVPRFLGRLAGGIHALRCDPVAAEEFVQRLSLADLRCELAVPVEVAITRKSITDRHRFSPAGPPRTERL